MAGWHGPLPKDDAWRQVTLASIAELGQRLWLRCNACGRDRSPQPEAFAAEHGLPLDMPLAIIARRLVCTHCGARKAQGRPGPYAIGKKARPPTRWSADAELCVNSGWLRWSAGR